MSFLRPTASSLRRAVTSSHADPTRSGDASTTSTQAVAPPASAAHGSTHADYGHITSRVDTGLRSRVRNSALPHRPAPPAPPSADTRSPVLREFADRCTTVIQRAEAVLERSLEQEARVASAMEGRHSQSPGRQCTPPPSQSESSTPPQRTPLASAPHASPVQTPAMPRAPPTTPASPSQTPAPPPTPSATPVPVQDGSPPPSQPGAGPASASGTVDAAARSPSPSLLQRLRQSLHRGRGAAGEAHVTASSVPCSPDGAALGASASRVSPRKSVRFVSPDKLETVTPTKVVAFSSDNDEVDDEDGDYGLAADEEEEEEDVSDEEEALLPLSKRARADSGSVTPATGGGGAHLDPSPQRPSAPLPPAPPPSALKDGGRRRSSSSGASAISGSRASGSRALPSASPPLSQGQRTRSPSASSESARATPPHRGSSGGRSSTSSTRPPLDHEELKAYVRQHTIRRSLHRISRANMEEFLLDEGVELPMEGHLLKRRLLKLIRDLLRHEAAL